MGFKFPFIITVLFVKLLLSGLPNGGGPGDGLSVAWLCNSMPEPEHAPEGPQHHPTYNGKSEFHHGKRYQSFR